MREKKEYNALEYNIVYFDENDIITTSGGDTSGLTSNQLNSGSNGGDISFDLFN